MSCSDLNADLESPGRLILVRHGATAWSMAGRHTGRTDPPLTEAGVAEARTLNGRLVQFKPAAVFTSPLRRARDTSRLAGFGDAMIDGRLLEWDYGDYEGLTFADIQDRRPGWRLFADGAPGGETLEDVGARADSFLDDLHRDAQFLGRDALVFAHAHLLCVLATRWLGLPPALARVLILDSSGIGVLGRKRSEPVIERWNC
jgi:broad specificity phosphatase PhoE